MDIVAFTERHPMKGETVVGTDLKYFPGGKGANQAIAAAKLGAETIMVGKVGEDAFGEKTAEFLQKQGVDCKISREAGIPTGTAIITVSALRGDNTIVVVPGANETLIPKDLEGITLEAGDILVSQFEVPTETVQAIFLKGKQKGTVNILNPAPAKKIPGELMGAADILILNETELGFLSGVEVNANDDQSISEAAERIKGQKQTLIVTLGERGAIGLTPGKVLKVEGKKVDAVDTTGAGDCFVGAFAAKLSEGNSIAESITFANAAASICVTREGAGPSMPTLVEVNQNLG